MVERGYLEMPKTLGEYFGMNVPRAGAMTLKQMEAMNLPESYKNEYTGQLVGIEVEVENANLTEQPNKVWSIKDDGSLRNTGREFVTAPIPASMAPFALQNLLRTALSQECCFGPRTSIHVHFNMITYDIEHIKDLVLFYAAFEPLFYRFIGRGRMKNIYCVPITEAGGLLYQLETGDLAHTVQLWSKYTGLNLVTLSNYGTIEARHMHGTFDVEKVSIWIRVWCKLIDFVMKNETKVNRGLLASLDSKTDYPRLLRDIFGGDDVFMKFREYKDIEKSVSTMKIAFIRDAQGYQPLFKERNTEQAPYFTFKKRA